MVAAVALASSTYAWFVNNAQVTATNVDVTATTAYSLQIKGSATDDTYGTTKDLNDSVTFTPVSSVGQLASQAEAVASTAGNLASISENELKFFASDKWNADGEVQTFLTVGKNTIADLDNDNDYVVGENSEDSYFYYADTVYLKAGQSSKIYLDSVNTGIAYTDAQSSAQVLPFDSTLTAYKTALGENAITGETLSPGEKAYDLVKTMRVAFVVTQGDTPTRTVYFYELNNGQIGADTSYNTTINSANGLNRATNSTTTTAEFSATDISNLNSTTVKTLTAAVMATGASTNLATTSTTSDSFATVAPNEEIQVDIYMWMEGCDHDTTAANSAKFDTKIQGLQFGFCIGAAS